MPDKLRNIIYSSYFWLALFILLLGAGTFAFFSYGGSAVPTQPQSDILRTVNAEMTKGVPGATVKIVEYADYLCPYCAKFEEEIMPLIERDYISNGKVEIEVRPVAVIAGDSQRAAEGAYCAAEQKKFWDYTAAAYSRSWNDFYSQGKKPEEVPIFKGTSIYTLADTANLDVTAFSSCLNSGKYTSAVQDATKKFESYSYHGTPSFFINEVQYQGYAPYNVVQPIIESYIRT